MATNEPCAVLDGSKLIIRARANQPIQVDQGLRIIFSSRKLRQIDRTLSFFTVVADAADTTVVVDACMPGQKFVPVPLHSFGGVLYTRDGVAHVVVSSGAGAIKRVKVSAKGLPCKAANKFTSNQSFPSQMIMGEKVVYPWNKTVTSGSDMGGVVFVRVDDSIFRWHLLDADDTAELHEGRPVMWTGSVTFAFAQTLFCYNRVHGAAGPGHLWIDSNIKSAAGLVAPR